MTWLNTQYSIIRVFICYDWHSCGRLAQRLMGISREQSIKTDMTTLLALAEKSDYDIRCCLATLYFLKSQKRQLRYSDVIHLNVGQKDTHKSHFQVWQEIFQIPRPKRREYVNTCDRTTLPMAPDIDRPIDPNLGNAASMPARYSHFIGFLSFLCRLLCLVWVIRILIDLFVPRFQKWKYGIWTLTSINPSDLCIYSSEIDWQYPTMACSLRLKHD